MKTPDSWFTRREAGSRSAIRFSIRIVEHLNRTCARRLLFLVVIYFLLVRRQEREGSTRFLTRVFGQKPKLNQVYRHFASFAAVTLDKFYIATNRFDSMQAKVVADPDVLEAVRSKKSGIFVSAHLGSFEVARLVESQLEGIRIKMCLDLTVSAMLNETLGASNPHFRDDIIDLSQSQTSLALSIRDSISNGTWVGFLADRYRQSDRTMTMPFLGSTAEFPVGPFVIASILGLPIIFVLCIPSGSEYVVFCKLISTGEKVRRQYRDEQIRANLNRYVSLLEEYTKTYPFSWFNFFDFWSK